ncbi:MAG TPA: hypothetical protein VL947_04235, partial [Cytophagales bacterium]|nr:hypothetical protein [Cytophagales bacterium]
MGVYNPFSKVLLLAFLYSTTFMGLPAKDGCETHGKAPSYLKRIGCVEDFKSLKGSPLSSKYHNVSTVK